MARPISPACVRRNIEIAERYKARETARELARTYGLTIVQIRNIVRGQGLALRPEPSPRATERPVIDETTSVLGFRVREFQLRTGLDLATLARQLRMSEPNLASAIRGTHDWRYTELKRASETLGLPVDELVGPRRWWTDAKRRTTSQTDHARDLHGEQRDA